MKLNPLTNTVSFLRTEIAADLARHSKGMIASIDEVHSVVHLAADRVLTLTKLDDAAIEEIHDTIDKLFHFLEHGTESAEVTVRIGRAKYTAELS